MSDLEQFRGQCGPLRRAARDLNVKPHELRLVLSRNGLAVGLQPGGRRIARIAADALTRRAGALQACDPEIAKGLRELADFLLGKGNDQ